MAPNEFTDESFAGAVGIDICCVNEVSAGDSAETLERCMKSGTRRDGSELFTDDGSDPGTQKLDRP
jgi:hypothetical protein